MPCIPTRVATPPTGPRWLHEIKHDGFRLIARREGDRVILRTRGGFNWAERYPRIVASMLALRVESIVIDGEVVVLNEAGLSDFDALQRRTNSGRASLLGFDRRGAMMAFNSSSIWKATVQRYSGTLVGSA